MKNNFVNNLTFLKDIKNETFANIGLQANVAANTVSNWLSKKTEPKLSELEKIAQYFEITLNELIYSDLQKGRFEQKIDVAKKNKKGKVYSIDDQSSSLAAEYPEVYQNSRQIEEKLTNYITFLELRVKALELEVIQLQQALDGFRSIKKQAG